MGTTQRDQFELATEREALDVFLDAQRECLIRKIEGVDDAAARTAPTASSLSLLGLLKHATIWERRWFQVVVAGHDSGEAWPTTPGGNESTFAVDDGDTVTDWVARYRAEIERSRATAAGLDLDIACARTDLIACNLRYVLFHLIEGTARHAGHADIIRESLDGVRGV